MKRDWFACDGHGHEAVEPTRVVPTVSRRGLIAGAALGWLSVSKALAQVTVSPQGGARNVLVSIFLRGGADGLNVVVPHGEDAYHRNRPVLRIGRPSEAGGALDLDGFFGFNPALAPVLPLFKEGKMAVLHAVGSGDQTRSHFEAMNAMERGLDGVNEGPSSGWLARHLIANPRENSTPLRAVAIGRTMPDSLRGATNALALESLLDFRLEVPGGNSEEARHALQDLYGTGSDPLTRAGRETLQVLETLNRLNPSGYQPKGYPDSDLGKALKQVAILV